MIPIPEYPPTRKCPGCGCELDDEDTVYEIDNEWVCADCCMQSIVDNYLVDDIAESLNIYRKASWECAADE